MSIKCCCGSYSTTSVKLYFFLAVAASCFLASCNTKNAYYSNRTTVTMTNNSPGKIDSLIDNRALVSLDSEKLADWTPIQLDDAPFYRAGDSLGWVNDTNISHWKRWQFGGERAANTWFLLPVKVPPSLANVPICFNFSFEGAVEIYLNGKLLHRHGIASVRKSEEIIKKGSDYFYIVFPALYNSLIIRTSNHLSDANPKALSAFQYSFCSEQAKRTALRSIAVSDAISMSLSIFFFAFFFIYMILFLSDRKVKVNFYFSLFCLFIFILFFLQTGISKTENPELDDVRSASNVAAVTLLFYSFIAFLHHLVFGNARKYLKWLLAVCLLLSAGIMISFAVSMNLYTILFCGLATVMVVLFATIDGIRVVIIGLKNKTRGIRPIIWGMLISMFLSIASLVIALFPQTQQYSFFSWAIALSVIPMSVAITLVNNYTKTGKLLAIELDRVKSLSEMTIKQQKEKQEILESQKERLEEQVTVRTAEIVQQKNEIQKQKELVESKNKDILDSISYAKRLQDAILPPVAFIKQHFPESFVFYKPKDIVAGDFYWLATPDGGSVSVSEGSEERSRSRSHTILIAACDCTGHGVPGALVSVVCSNALNRTVNEFKVTQPGKILDKVRELVLETFEKSESEVKDGMDVSMCHINSSTGEVEWSGAYNPLWYVHKGQISELRADKQPIGKHDKPSPFNTQKIKLEKGDCLYLFTDGYADQFGGPNGKKFKYKQFQELIAANSGNSMQVQKELLDRTLENWKGSLDQVDDILVIGIKL